MSILSLSTENKDKLLQLIESLEEVFEQKDDLTQRAEPFVKRMNEITVEKIKLDEKSKKYDATNFKSTVDATELSNIILKSKQLDEEIEAINASSKSLNIEFDAIINQENEIISKIKELIELASKEINQENESILVEKLGFNVFVIKPSIPDTLCLVDRSANEIINCQADIVKSLWEIYSENSVEIVNKVGEDDFKELEKYFLASKAQKEQSIDEKLPFLPKDSSSNVEQPEEKVVEKPKIEISIESNNIETQVQEKESVSNDVEVPMQVESSSNILSLDSILQENKPVETNAIDSNIIIIKDRFDNSNSKVANSNKTKLQNIINNFKGTYVLPIIKSEVAPKVEAKPVDPISSFINPKAA